LTSENGTTADVLDEEGTGFKAYLKGKQLLDLPEDRTIVVRLSGLEAYLQTDARKTPEKSLGTREKDNLLILIAALAKQAAIDPKQRGTPKRFQQALSKRDSRNPLSLRTLQDIVKDLNDRRKRNCACFAASAPPRLSLVQPLHRRVSIRWRTIPGISIHFPPFCGDCVHWAPRRRTAV
jgi:hypothetical protein